MKNNLIISPKTKVSQLIEAYPQLKEVLTGYAPAFKKIKNPALWDAVAKVSTLQQIALTGNQKVEDLINHLRRAVGQDEKTFDTQDMENTKEFPEWLKTGKITKELDVREMLAAGEHPVNLVISEVQGLNTSEIYKVIAPFLPAPMIDKVKSLGFKHFVESKPDSLYFVYFMKE